jgi:hypothetical protein
VELEVIQVECERAVGVRGSAADLVGHRRLAVRGEPITLYSPSLTANPR